MRRLGSQLRKQWFLLGLALVVVAGLLWPDAGEQLGTGGALATIAVVGIFVLLGLSLETRVVGRNLRQWRAHAFIEGFIFIAVPVSFWATAWLFSDAMDGRLTVGLLALAVLPTTVSSCVVLTQSAGGSVPTALTNAVVSNLAGVVVSPLLLSVLLRRGGLSLPPEEIGRILLSVGWKVLLPFLAGQIARRWLGPRADRRRRAVSTASSLLVLLMIFLAFSKAAGDAGLRRGLGELLGPFVYLAAMNLALMGAAWGGARLIGLRAGERVAAVFCGPQKTLAMGVPLLTTVFADRPALLGAALLPLMFYHPWQLMTASVARSVFSGSDASDRPSADSSREKPASAGLDR